ncbi:MAG: hypothetical protein DMD96_35480 [Candidatus Rokuibacteriota bacterium]|nr:MAG: hypothetical protein DMD96_35480 [Candidatus Rokubacteria bacterium]
MTPRRSRHRACGCRSRPRSGHAGRARRLRARPLRWRSRIAPARVKPVAECILLLASDDASYVTGTLLFVDGGYTAM